MAKPPQSVVDDLKEGNSDINKSINTGLKLNQGSEKELPNLPNSEL